MSINNHKIIVRKPTNSEIKESETWEYWEKEPSIFDWTYYETEKCYILDGTAEVKLEKGDIVKFTKGDFVIFPKGLRCKWEILKTIKKKYKFE